MNDIPTFTPKEIDAVDLPDGAVLDGTDMPTPSDYLSFFFFLFMTTTTRILLSRRIIDMGLLRSEGEVYVRSGERPKTS